MDGRNHQAGKSKPFVAEFVFHSCSEPFIGQTPLAPTGDHRHVHRLHLCPWPSPFWVFAPGTTIAPAPSRATPLGVRASRDMDRRGSLPLYVSIRHARSHEDVLLRGGMLRLTFTVPSKHASAQSLALNVLAALVQHLADFDRETLRDQRLQEPPSRNSGTGP